MLADGVATTIRPQNTSSAFPTVNLEPNTLGEGDSLRRFITGVTGVGLGFRVWVMIWLRKGFRV